MSDKQNWFAKNDFLLRRLHSLSGLIPVGAYMVVHLTTNSLILVGDSSFQNAVYAIHSLGPLLLFVEWGAIFLPLIFHAVFGVVIILTGKNNVSKYSYTGNVRYMLQRVTGVIALIFIFMHVFHLHGWIHVDAWLDYIAKPLGMASFKPYNAASTAAAAMQSSIFVPVLYAIGVLACVFHFANGIWTMGITWGVWTTPKGQKRATYAVTAIGVVVSLIGLSAIGGFLNVDVEAAREVEDRMYEQRTKDGSVIPDSHKRTEGDEEHETVGQVSSNFRVSNQASQTTVFQNLILKSEKLSSNQVDTFTDSSSDDSSSDDSGSNDGGSIGEAA